MAANAPKPRKVYGCPSRHSLYRRTALLAARTPVRCARLSGTVFDRRTRDICAVIYAGAEVPTIPSNRRTAACSRCQVQFDTGFVPIGRLPCRAPREDVLVRARRERADALHSSHRLCVGPVRVWVGSGRSSIGGKAANGFAAPRLTVKRYEGTGYWAEASARVAARGFDVGNSMILGLGMTSVARHSEPRFHHRARVPR